MSPEFGSTCAIFPVDAETLRYLDLTGRPTETIELVDAYAREQGMFHDESSPDPVFSDLLELDLGEVVPSIAGPKRPQDRVPLAQAKESFLGAMAEFDPEAAERMGNGRDEAMEESFPASDPPAEQHDDERGKPRPAIGGAPATTVAHASGDEVEVTLEDGTAFGLDHGRVVIAAITSCTNTSNPSVMVGAGLLARKAVEKGLTRKPWVKTSLAPGSTVVTEYLERAGLTEYLDALQFNLVGYGCTTCIGNSGPLAPEISAAIAEKDLAVCAVLSGNRNFEGRINQDVKANYLASPPLVVAYALAGRMDLDLVDEPLGAGSDGEPVYLRDIWPSAEEIKRVVGASVASEMFARNYAEVFSGDEAWNAVDVPSGDRYTWPDSTYVRQPSFFEHMPADPPGVEPIAGARALALLGDSITTDHISPAGAIKKESPAGKWLMEQGVEPRDFNSYGSRRGNHEVMIRGTFANIRLRNQLVDQAGGFTRHFPDGEETTIYDAAMAYAEEGVPLVVLAGKEYGSGSSRDWAAKGTKLLGVRAVIAESFERIHRSNLIGMGVLPLQFAAGENVASLGLSGEESLDFDDLGNGEAKSVTVTAKRGDGSETEFEATVRLDTPNEVTYFQNGGILQTVLRNLKTDRG
jgi:aconitate hydratase A / 2-methylisocitrate dehydratase